MIKVTRRSFIKRGASILAVIAGGAAIASLFRQLFPRSIGQKKRVKVGKTTLFPVDIFTYIEEMKIYIYRDHEGVRAVTAVCTHLGCILEINDEGFNCPCHGSCYNKRGDVLSGPAPTALTWFQVSKAPDGQLIIDMTRKVTPDFKFLTV
jgi:cytochrome b6-f complex iron-sulfur subunit